LTKAALREIARREREKVKKELFEQVKERYLQARKMKINVVRVDMMKKQRKLQ
jgi:thymidylate kinase